MGDPWDVKGDVAETVGRTIASVEREDVGTDERLTLFFTDGTHLSIQSSDYEGYSSQLYVSVEEDAAAG